MRKGEAMKFTKSDQLEAIQDVLRLYGMQVPLPTQFLRSAIVPSNFDNESLQRIHTITRATIEDFSYSQDCEGKYLDELPLWLWNIKICSDFILRIPIWRGEKPFVGESESDDTVLEIVKRCFAKDGLDIQNMSRWIAAAARGGVK